MADWQPRVLSDIEALKALAHPLRQQILTRLQQRGSATSADLSTVFDVDRGAASYHLRQLARFGFVEEDTERSAGRRRYWQAVAHDLRLPRYSTDPDITAVAFDVGRQWLERSENDLHTYLSHRDKFGEFAVAAQHSFGGTALTEEELVQFGEEYIDFLKRWHRDPAPDRRHITVLFHAFPTPDATEAS